MFVKLLKFDGLPVMECHQHAMTGISTNMFLSLDNVKVS